MAHAVGAFSAAGIRAEGAAGAALAALPQLDDVDGTIVLIVTGRNIDDELHREGLRGSRILSGVDRPPPERLFSCRSRPAQPRRAAPGRSAIDAVGGRNEARKLQLGQQRQRPPRCRIRWTARARRACALRRRGDSDTSWASAERLSGTVGATGSSPRVSSTSSADSSGVAPWRRRSFVPTLRADVISPGAAKTSRPSSSAKSAVIRAPDRSRASTTTVARARPAMILLRAGKRHGDGSTPGGYSETTRPLSAIRRASSAWARG